ncbi:MAG: NADH-quinone oxidoreductase subunit L [Actinobacteria bacterium]|nr:MAG: NADH-quinone oxidoreductase subunit L [Actinomycetota bacterium]
MIYGAWICLLSPLAAAGLITLGGQRLTRRAAGYLATLSCFVAFGGALATFIGLLGRDGSQRQVVSTAWLWLTAGSYRSGLEVLIDPLSVFMMLVVAGVGALIVAYSIGYMDGDIEERRYFAYMSLFVFSMLLLVQGGNLLLLLAGWGMVGLSSYLLIGFWHDRPSAIAAAKKAFVMNAIGDATMALAFFLLIKKGNSLEFGILGGQYSSTVANLVALGLLGGAVAKSAQLPLQTWLPDAMEGPTPVSALIHAATMVTAGVYLLVRTHAIFEQAPKIADLAAGLGAATLLLAGLIALVQVDIKRVIAYSTMSQIGYMFLGAGLGAFFKALLFMAAGIVIHALAAEQDMRKMGGLRMLMPRTYWAFLIGALALVGIPPFAGFFSKDSILAAAMDHGAYGYVLWVVGLAGTFLTGLYTFRMFFLVFWGEPSAFVREHFHALRRDVVGVSMASTVGVLAVLSVIGGWLQFAPIWHPVETWLQTVAEPVVSPTNWQEAISSALAFVLGLAGITVAWLVYGARRVAVPRFASAQRTLERKFSSTSCTTPSSTRPRSS